jgi:hypothetical protein
MLLHLTLACRTEQTEMQGVKQRQVGTREEQDYGSYGLFCICFMLHCMCVLKVLFRSSGWPFEEGPCPQGEARKGGRK